MMPLQTALPAARPRGRRLRDRRARRARLRLAPRPAARRRRLADRDLVRPAGYIAGYRRLPGSSGCRVTTEAAIAALALHPERRRSPETRRALDLLLQRETRDEWALGSEVERLSGTGVVPGFVTAYARFDLALRARARDAGGRRARRRQGRLDRRVPRGRAAGPPACGSTRPGPELSRWLTFELLLSRRRLAAGDWAGTAPSLPFHGTGRRRGGW